MENTTIENTEDVITDISEETLLSLDENLELDQENTEIAEGKCKKEGEDMEDEKMIEAEVSSDEEFMEYAKSILKAAHGDKYDEDKAMAAAEGILKKADGDYGAAIGMLTSGLGEGMEELDENKLADIVQKYGFEKAKSGTFKGNYVHPKTKDYITPLRTDGSYFGLSGPDGETLASFVPIALLPKEMEKHNYKIQEELDEEISWDLIQSMYVKDLIDYVVVPFAAAGVAFSVLGVAKAKQKIKDWFADKKDAADAKKMGMIIKDAIEKIKKDSKAQDMIAQINANPYDKTGSNTERNKLIKPYKAHLKAILSDEQYEVLDDIYFASLKEQSEMEKQMEKEMESDMEKDMTEDTQSEIEIAIDSSDISRLVESEAGLTEEFKEKATTIFEAAVKSKIKEAEEALKESYAVTLIEEVEAIKEGMVDKIDNYLTYAVECWVEENKVAIESSLRTEIAENFIKSLKGVFVENYIEVPEGKVDLYAKLEEEKAAAESKLAESLELLSGLAESVENLSREKIINEYTSDLADTQAEKLKSLIEDVQYSSEEKFRSKVETIKEFYINGPLFNSETKTLNEEVEDSTHSFITTETIVENESEAQVSPAMKNYLTAISRLSKATTANLQ